MCPYLSAANLIALGSLVVGAFGLYFLVRYVGYTKQIAQEAVSQSEAGFKPALIAISGGSTGANCKLRNVGKGPALDVEWHITGSQQKGLFSCIEASINSGEMVHSNDHTLVNAALQNLQTQGKEQTSIVCSYHSVSGKRYTSESLYAPDHTFSTTFKEEK
jgi:hypothetical protein